MFAAVDGYLVPQHPLIELGAGIGMLSAYMNDKLTMSVNQVSVEPNPYLIPSLNLTKQNNDLGVTFVQKAIEYGRDLGDVRYHEQPDRATGRRTREVGRSGDDDLSEACAECRVHVEYNACHEYRRIRACRRSVRGRVPEPERQQGDRGGIYRREEHAGLVCGKNEADRLYGTVPGNSCRKRLCDDGLHQIKKKENISVKIRERRVG